MKAVIKEKKLKKRLKHFSRVSARFNLGDKICYMFKVSITEKEYLSRLNPFMRIASLMLQTLLGA